MMELQHDSSARVFAALADVTRLRIVDLLKTGEERSGSELAEALNISLALFCHHSKILTDAGVMVKRKEGQVKLCSLNQPLLQALKDWM